MSVDGKTNVFQHFFAVQPLIRGETLLPILLVQVPSARSVHARPLPVMIQIMSFINFGDNMAVTKPSTSWVAALVSDLQLPCFVRDRLLL
jgi:hypothetical protein